jgi:AraC-like DNA-binding protein
MATWSGCGEILVDGEWVIMKAGQACILPARLPSAHRAISRQEAWSFSWVRYEEPLESMPITSATRPVIRPYDAAAITHAIQGLHLAVTQTDALRLQQQWVDLIHGYVTAFEEPSLADARIRQAWLQVKDALQEPWDVASMADLANVSAEHFRRLCHAHLGRSPVKHLTFLRLQEAVRLLQTTSATIESIAHAVGYQSSAALSKSLAKWTGFRPGALRKQGRVTAPLV